MADMTLAYTPATTLARLIREKKVSPVEVVENSLARIEEVNGALNAFCFTYPEEALAQAREAERAVMAKEPLGPLHGVPIAIKDLTPTKGKRTTLGSKIYENWVPDFDVPIVERLRAAGSIMVGKTTTPEFAYAGFCKSALWGDTNNPWDTSRSPGGSSGGSGAAVATGCVPLAEGTDAGGSVRIPAAFCGTVGLKPTFGRIPLQMLPTAFDDLLHFGPLSRTVADAALFLSVTQGPDDRDFLSLPAGPEISVPPPSDIRGLKLALNYDFGFYAIDDDVRAQTQEAVRALEEAGATVEEVEIAWTRDVIDRWVEHWGVLQAACFGQHLGEWRDRMDPVLVSYMDRGLAMNAVDFKKIEIYRTQMWEDVRPIFAEYDALLTPTCAQPPPPNDTLDPDYYRLDEQGRFCGLYMTYPFNFLHQCPALAVPSGVTKSGLPTSLQIVGRRHDDNGVLRIGAALEAFRPWAGRTPPI